MTTLIENNPTTELFTTLKKLNENGWFVPNIEIKSEEEMVFNTIDDYNDYLVNNKILKPVIEYVLTLSRRFWSQREKEGVKCITQDQILTLMSYIDRDDFCIPQEMLKEYGVFTNIDSSKDIKKGLERKKLVEGVDYNQGQVSLVRTDRGDVLKNIYTLTPRGFKKCLMRGQNTDHFADYYLDLEKSIVYYNRYQLALSHKYVILMETRIELSEHGIAMLKQDLKEGREKAKENMQRLMKKTEADRQEHSEQIQTILKHLNIAEKQAERVEVENEKMSKKVPPYPINPEKLEHFVLFKLMNNDKYQYRMLTGEWCHIEKVGVKIHGSIILTLENHPSPIKLRKCLRENQYGFRCTGSYINLLSIDESELKRIIIDTDKGTFEPGKVNYIQKALEKPVYSEQFLFKHSKNDLQDICRANKKYRGFSQLNKRDLVEHIMKHQ